MQISEQEYDDFRKFLEDACGIVLGTNKHYLVTSRLNRLIREFEITSFGELMKRLRLNSNAKLRESIINAMTTNETQWFRDNYPFDILTQAILPELAKNKTSQLRIWSAASSSGQEAYSISILIQEFLQGRPGSLPGNIQIIGTDISSSMVQIAEKGAYERMALSRGLTAERLQRFFIQHGEQWVVRPEIRNRVTFRELNLLNSYAALGRFDIVFCRNVLIYFSNEIKRDILNRIAQVMMPRGYLFLGGSESPTTYTDAFEMIRTPQGVVYRLK